MIFVRFQGCPLKCIWCDTIRAKEKETKCRIEKKPSSGDWNYIENPCDLEDIVEQLGHLYTPDTFAVGFTGGEPLSQSSFLKELAQETKTRLNYKTYLETSAYALEFLKNVIDLIDFVKIDIKPPEAQAVEYDYDKLLRSEMDSIELSLSLKKSTIIKVVVTNLTEVDWFKNVCSSIKGIDEKSDILNFTIQPVSKTATFDKIPDQALLFKLSAIAGDFFSARKIRVLPQVHKMLNVL